MSVNVNMALPAAISYCRCGYAVIPVPYRSKKPVISEWNTLRLTEEELPQYFNGQCQNVGVILGEPSGGLVDVDLDSPEAVRLADEFLPNTAGIFGRAGKPGSHRLYVCEPIPRVTQFRDVDGTMIVELRGTGGQTIFPGSLHPNGEPIEWVGDGKPKPIDLDILDEAVRRLAAAVILARHWPKIGARHNAALALAGGLIRSKCMAPEDMGQFIRVVAETAGDEETADRASASVTTARRMDGGGTATGWPRLAEVLRRDGQAIVKRVCKWLLIRQGHDAACDFHFSDDGNSQRLVNRHGRAIRYCGAMGWFVWTGQRWERDETYEVLKLAKDTVRALFHEAAGVEATEKRNELGKHALKSQAEPRLRAMIQLAPGEPDIAIRPDVFDEDRWLLNVQNGTLDLRTGTLRPHLREDLLTKLAGAAYDEDARCPLWDKFLKRVTGGDTELIAFMQRAVGHALTGIIAEHVVHFLYGTGANGKSTFVATVIRMMGDYGKMAAPKLLIRSTHDRPLNELADLWGTRFAANAELGDGSKLDEERLKYLSGGDQITARFLYKNLFRFWPQHKLFIVTNTLPALNNVDDAAVWRRILVWPFAVAIPSAEQDPDLPRKLDGELSGILRWAVEGCNDWRDRGNRLNSPSAVTAASATYRGNVDTVHAWIDARCVREAAEKTPFGDLYQSYLDYCRDNDVKALTDTSLGISLGRKGFRPDRDSKTRWREGLRLKAAHNVSKSANP